MRNWIVGLLLCLNIALGLQAQGQAHQDIVVLHVNDTHSRIEPLPKNAPRHADKGGMVRMDAYLREVRAENDNVLFLHSGDFVQGTPYFNLFKGKVEVETLNLMQVDAVAIGNHEFDYGLGVLKDLVVMAQFPVLATNLDFTETELDGLTHPYIILERGGVKIGLIGLSPDPDGLVAKDNYKGMVYLDPVESSNRVADYLRDTELCDLIICLSHLGYYTKENAMGDITLAKQTRNIDIILGGHTHGIPDKPVYVKNRDGKEVLIDQCGDRGIDVGRLDIRMEEKK